MEELLVSLARDGPVRIDNGRVELRVSVAEGAPPCAGRLAMDGREDVERAVLEDPPAGEVGHDIFRRLGVVGPKGGRDPVRDVCFTPKGKNGKKSVPGIGGLGAQTSEEHVQDWQHGFLARLPANLILVVRAGQGWPDGGHGVARLDPESLTLGVFVGSDNIVNGKQLLPQNGLGG